MPQELKIDPANEKLNAHNHMKACPYCGAEYPDDTLVCPIDQTPISPEPAAPKSISARPNVLPRAEFEFAELTPAQRQLDLVTLVRCGTLMSADLLVSRLRAAGIEAFIPDQSVVQAMGFNLNAVGYVRVQVSPDDYDAAKALLSE